MRTTTRRGRFALGIFAILALEVDGGDQARATGITIGGVTYDSSNVDRPIRLTTYVQRWAWLPGADHRIVPAE